MNDFKNSLKTDTPLSNQLDILLSNLGLWPLPENVIASISEDMKYLNIKIKDTDKEKHLLFQFPLEEQDFSSLKNREDYQDLISRYNSYINEYIDEIKKYAMAERTYLHEKFPELIFNIKIRIKSYESYLNKINQNINEAKDPYINDIMAERIIISKYKDSEDETLLKEMCYKVAQALYDFRISTNFRMKKEISPNNANSKKEYITKDYIKNPKGNGYQSLHILTENKDNPDLTYETQIRTFEMENMSKKSDKIAHSIYKPRVLNDLSANKVPVYSEITPFVDKQGNPIVIDMPLSHRFYHFYNTSYHQHQDEENSHTKPITYERFKSEQYNLEKALGIKFKQLRKNIRNTNTSKNIRER